MYKGSCKKSFFRCLPPTPLELIVPIFVGVFFKSLKRSFFLVARLYPPPLSSRTTKKLNFFCSFPNTRKKIHLKVNIGSLQWRYSFVREMYNEKIINWLSSSFTLLVIQLINYIVCPRSLGLFCIVVSHYIVQDFLDRQYIMKMTGEKIIVLYAVMWIYLDSWIRVWIPDPEVLYEGKSSV